MKKIMAVLAMALAVVMAAPFSAPLQAANYHIVIQPMEGEAAPEILEPGVQPFVQDGRLLVPLRSLAEALGFEVELSSDMAGITIQGVGRRVLLAIGSTEASINGSSASLEVPPMVVENRTMVPLRFVGEALNYQVYYANYIDNEGTAYILPYNIVPISEITDLFNRQDSLHQNFPYPEAPWYYTLYLTEGFKTRLGISLGQTIEQVTGIYGIPEKPVRRLDAYGADYNGTMEYPGPFTPRSGDYSRVELTFENGILIQYKLVPPAD